MQNTFSTTNLLLLIAHSTLNLRRIRDALRHRKISQKQSKSTKIGNSNAQRLPVESQLVVVLLAWPTNRVNANDDGKG
jgi:hypothetical protein